MYLDIGGPFLEASISKDGLLMGFDSCSAAFASRLFWQLNKKHDAKNTIARIKNLNFITILIS
jgi:hypothetical protein